MADDYGLNFGFRRSGESMSVREGRLSVPAGGPVWPAAGSFHQGDFVTIDPASPGFLKLAPANTPAQTGVSGLLVQEDPNLFDSIYNRIGPGILHDSYDLGRIINNRLAIIWAGAGVKFWVKNTLDVTRPDGSDVPAVQLLDASAMTLGGLVAWDGTKYVGTATAADAIGTCTFISADLTYAEIVLH